MTLVVLDTSVAVKWVAVEDFHVEAATLRLAWEARRTEIAVPSWFACEFANVLFQRTRKGTLSFREARIGLVDVLGRVTPREFEPGDSLRALEIAHAFGLTASYDSHYLALAERLDCDLWTADAKFYRAVGAQFPRVRWIGEIA